MKHDIPPKRSGVCHRASLGALAALALAVPSPAQGASKPVSPNSVPAQQHSRPATPVFGGSEAARELWAAQAQYEAERKHPAWAFGWELLLPGAGNVYAGEKEEALLTWTGLAIGGFFLADGYGLFCEAFQASSTTCRRKTFYIIQGWVFVIGSRLFGLTSAPTNVSRNNRALRSRLGLDGPVSFGIAPWLARHDGGVRLSLRF